jgi:hypothetical protein
MFARLPGSVQDRARKAFRLFQAEPAHPSLSFERLAFRPDIWSVRVTRDIRAVCKIIGDVAYGIGIGTHAEFDRAFPRG